MKRTITLLTAAMLGAAALHAAPANLRPFHSGFEINKVLSTTTVSRADAATLTVTFTGNLPIDAEGRAVAAARIVDGNTEVYKGEPADGGAYTISLPAAGSYDVFVFGYVPGTSNDNTGSILMTYENYSVTAAGATLAVNTDDAVNRVNIHRMGRNGKELSLPTQSNPQGDNAYGGIAYSFIFYNNAPVNIGAVMMMGECENFCLSNSKSGKFTLGRVDQIVGPEGADTFFTDIDFNLADAGPQNSAEWQSMQVDFQPTPTNIIDEQVGQAAGRTGRYAMGRIQILINGHNFGASGHAGDGPETTASVVGLWKPSGYSGLLDVWAYPAGQQFASDDSGMMASALRMGEGALTPVGLNFVFGDESALTADSDIFGQGNPLFANLPVGILGNCAPAYVGAWRFTRPMWMCVGNQGETMSIDTFNKLDYVGESSLEKYGGQTNTFKAEVNGEVIAEGRDAYFYDVDWYAEGQWKISLSTDNILINGSIPGKSSCEFTYDTADMTEDYFYLPSLTALTFRGTADQVTNTFPTPADARAIIYASTLTYDYDPDDPNYRSFFRYKPVRDITVEYAPMNTDDFLPLTAEADPSKDFYPGYGQYFGIDLGGIDREAPRGWFDMRVTVTAPDGSSQRQVISPAFQIQSFTSIATAVTDSDLPAEYYTLQGIRVSNPQPGAIYIERRGDTARKVIF